MWADASVDIRCAKFTWHVEQAIGTEPPADLSLGRRTCYDKNSYVDITASSQIFWSRAGCADHAGRDKTMKSGDADIHWKAIGIPPQPLDYSISWVESCDRDREQSLGFPVEGDYSINCTTIIIDNYLKCKALAAYTSITPPSRPALCTHCRTRVGNIICDTLLTSSIRPYRQKWGRRRCH